MYEFKELQKLKSEMDRYEKEAMQIEDGKAVSNSEEYIKAIINYLNYGREYYDDESLTLVELNKLFDIDCGFNSVQSIDYYEQDETMSYIASSVFDDTHYGSAITDAEFEYRKNLQSEYADEIEFAKLITTNNPNFESMSYKNKINYVANLLVQLHSKKEDTDEISLS